MRLITKTGPPTKTKRFNSLTHPSHYPICFEQRCHLNINIASNIAISMDKHLAIYCRASYYMHTCLACLSRTRSMFARPRTPVCVRSLPRTQSRASHPGHRSTRALRSTSIVHLPPERHRPGARPALACVVACLAKLRRRRVCASSASRRG